LAREFYQRAQQIQQNLVEDNREMPWSCRDLASTYFLQAELESGSGNSSEVIRLHKLACDLRQQLAREFPAIAPMQQDLVRSYMVLARVYRNQGQLDASAEYASKAAALQRQYPPIHATAARL
jgi:tetratricopeptide (TPR) repeat protein